MKGFWIKLARAIGTEVIVTGKVKGKYMTAIKLSLFGISVFEEYRKASEVEKKAARKATK